MPIFGRMLPVLFLPLFFAACSGGRAPSFVELKDPQGYCGDPAGGEKTWEGTPDFLSRCTELKGRPYPTAVAGTTTWIRIPLPDLQVDDAALHMVRNACAVKAFVNGNEIYKFSSPEGLHPGKFHGWNEHLIRLPYAHNAREVVLAVYCGYALPVMTTRYGNRHDIVKDNALIGLEYFFVGSLGVFLGLLCLIIFVFRRNEALYPALAVLYTSAGTFILATNPVFSWLVPEPRHRILFEYISLFLIPAGGFAFAELAVLRHLRRLVRIGWICFAAYGPLMLVLDQAGIYPLSRALLPYQISIIVLIIPFLVLIAYEAVKGNVQARFLAAGLSILALTGTHAILSALGTISGRWFFDIGLLAFFVSLSLIVFHRIRGVYITVQETSTELELKNRRLRELDRLKDEFLANTSHELRTPLTGITGIAESLLRGIAGPLNDRARDNLSYIVSSARRLANLVNDILDASRLQRKDLSLQLRDLDVRQIVELSVRLSAPLIGSKDIEISADLPETELPVTADEDRLQQILLNLIGNALKFTESGNIVVKAVEKGSRVMISVSDTGIGIPADRMDAIFNAFEQADGSTARRYGGTGLGLAITRDLVRLHGGEIIVESESGKGSVFTFDLPHASGSHPSSAGASAKALQIIRDLDEAAEKALHLPGKEPPALQNARRVLVVDDEPINRRVLENHLELARYAVISAETGEEALDRIKNDTPDVVLLDVMMPGMSGYDVCLQARASFTPQDLPIIMMTAKNQASDLVDAFSAGANDYLTKPFHASELLARIAFHLDLSDMGRRLRKMNEGLEELVRARTRDLDAAVQNLREKDRLIQYEMSLASRIQDELRVTLPAHFPELQIHGLYNPLSLVSGDFYDIVSLRDGGTAVLLGDATGHGVPAALIVEMTRAIFRAALDRFDQPSQILAYMNNALEKGVAGSGHFVTATLVYQRPGAPAVIVNGGHTPALLVDRRSGELSSLVPDGAILGALTAGASDFPHIELSIPPECMLVLYTDGITEIRSPAAEEFGLDRFSSFLVEHRNLSGRELVPLLEKELSRFADGRPPHDDATCLFVESTAPRASV